MEVEDKLERLYWDQELSNGKMGSQSRECRSVDEFLEKLWRDERGGEGEEH